MSNEATLLDEVEEVDDSILQTVEDGLKKPTMGSPEWTQYILDQLTDKEVVNIKDKKFPRMDGLRRICTDKYGRIAASNSSITNAIYTERGLICVAEHTLTVERYGDGEIKTVTGVSDAREEFLQPPFSQYVSANSSTKAMSRAFRDMLELQVLVAEELNSVSDIITQEEPEDAQPADDAQKSAIKTVSRKLGIDVSKLINMGPIKHTSLDKVLKGTARKIMSILNGYQDGTNNIPDEIKINV